jgi:crossover junction endodeoxyribonuclease RuvC
MILRRAPFAPMPPAPATSAPVLDAPTAVAGRVLGIDPGLRITGYGCIEGSPFAPRLVEAGVIRLVRSGATPRAARYFPSPDGPPGAILPPRESVSARLVELERDLADLLRRLRPDTVAVESFFVHRKHPATAIAMAHARGVVLLTVRKAGLSLVELPPAAVKKAVAAYGQAGKGQMQRAVQALFQLPEPPSPPDVADALAIALCAARRRA